MPQEEEVDQENGGWEDEEDEKGHVQPADAYPSPQQLGDIGLVL